MILMNFYCAALLHITCGSRGFTESLDTKLRGEILE